MRLIKSLKTRLFIEASNDFPRNQRPGLTARVSTRRGVASAQAHFQALSIVEVIDGTQDHRYYPAGSR